MVRRIGFWQRAVWIAFAVVLAHAAPAQALITLEGEESATFEWAAASGPVAGYYVVLGRTDSNVLYYFSTVIGQNWATIAIGEPAGTIDVTHGEAFTVGVTPFDDTGRVGPMSQLSERLVFMPAPPPDDGSPPDDGPPPDDGSPPDDDPPDDPPPVKGADAVTPFDFDGDGMSDLLVRVLRSLGRWKGDMKLCYMDGQGIADIASFLGLGRDTTIVGNGDYDGDGLADILWLDDLGGRVGVFFMDGNRLREVALLEGRLSSGSEIVGNGDYNGDGFSDVLIYEAPTNRFMVWLMAGVGDLQYSALPDDFRDDAEVIASGDFDGDGVTDILWRHPPSGDVDIWGLTGDLSLGALEGDADEWAIIGAGDFDGDGRDDLLLREPSSDLLAVRLSTRGARDQIDYDRNETTRDRQVVAMGDYDGDGRTDLVVYNSSSSAFWVWYMNGLAVTHGEKLGNRADPGDWAFASVDQRKPGSR